MTEGLLVNPDKQEIVEADGKKYYCYAIKTHVVNNEDKIEDVVKKYGEPLLEPEDILFMSEKMVACTEGRAYPIKDVKPRWLARFLSRFVVKTDYGIGLAMPETMEMAIRECGTFRILIAAFCGAVGKLFRKKGWFYIVAGYKAAAVDGPCDCTLPPYNKYVVLAPKDPQATAKKLTQALQGHNTVMIVDLNDLGGKILASSDPDADLEFFCKLLKQNPLGQSAQQTPMGLLRPLKENA